MLANTEACNCVEHKQPQPNNNSISESLLVKLGPNLREMLVLLVRKLVHSVDVVH
jgi:hypothetical protein